jgi:hypothetical protein
MLGLGGAVQHKLSFESKIPIQDMIERDYIEQKIKRELLVPQTDKSEQRRIVKSFLHACFVEISSFCNRRCWFCPNKFLDRHSERIPMREDTWLKVLSDLRQINYNGVFGFYLYNEPLADRELILKRVRQAREYLPNATFCCNTNTDFLTADYIPALDEAGLDLLFVQGYLAENEKWDIDRVLMPKFQEIGKKIGLNYRVELRAPDAVRVQYRLPAGTRQLQILGVSFDFKSSWGSNRGGLVDVRADAERIMPCYDPCFHMYVQFTGNVMGCCEARDDSPAHNDFILGKLGEDGDLFQIWTNEKAAQLRQNATRYDTKTGPCARCNARQSEDLLFLVNMFRIGWKD